MRPSAAAALLVPMLALACLGCESGHRIFVHNERAQPILVFFDDWYEGAGPRYLVEGNSSGETVYGLGNLSTALAIYDAASCVVLDRLAGLDLGGDVVVSVAASGSLEIHQGNLPESGRVVANPSSPCLPPAPTGPPAN
jgi:hypothetical protein